MTLSLKKTLTDLFRQALTTCFGADYAALDPMIQIAGRAELGDYQANFALSLAKRLGEKPQDVANKVLPFLEQGGQGIAEFTVSGPGFINVRFSPRFLNQSLTQVIADRDFASLKTSTPQTIVVDYGSANVAKEMHVGHLRSAIIGDALVRLFTLQGHHVIRQNHVGDWGTQFGMLIEYLMGDPSLRGGVADAAIQDLNTLYKQAKTQFDEDADFAQRARERVVLLQSGDPDSVAIWKALVAQSEAYFQAIYQRLDVSLTQANVRGESFYNPRLPSMVDTLLAQHIATLSEGAVVIDLPGFVDQNNQPLPLLIRKSDGASLYASTDLAAAEFRIHDLKADRIVYVTDARQKLHFQMLFAAIKKIGWATDAVQLDHVAFGTVLGENKKPFKTRSGDTIRLADLIDEAEERALTLLKARDTETLSEAELKTRAHAIGVGALKYADLSTDLVKDYVFNWNHLLAFEGNTAPYLQNAYVRIQAIFRKGNIDPNAPTIVMPAQASIQTISERNLILKLLGFSDILQQVSEELRPHKLCTYLYELAERFHAFYENCPILNNGDADQKNTRLSLSALTGRVLKVGLGILGIQTLEKM